MTEFGEALDRCGLRELPFKGNRFTWDNNRSGEAFIQERLDMGFANAQFLELFGEAYVHHLSRMDSDHVPILIRLSPSTKAADRGKGPRPFRFEAMWLEDEGCQSIIENGWENPGSRHAAEGVLGKIARCAEDLRDWDWIHFGNVRRELVRVRDQIQNLCSRGIKGRDVERRRELEEKERELRRREEILWCQRAKANELNWGDRNTAYFHRKASDRKRQNEVKKLIDNNGCEWKGFEGKAKVAKDYFENLFRSELQFSPDSAIQGIEQLVSAEDNAMLLMPFTVAEVKNALFQMHPTKAPGPDGMSALFFQKNWHIVGPEVTEFVLSILKGAPIPSNLNYTFISLLPKVKNPCRMTELRPISLCNVLYKIVSKVITNRLKKCMSKLVSQSQSAFVPGRLITDNVLAAFEIFHHMKKKREGRRGYMAVKLDMAKAYDRVEWDYLRRCMQKLGFADAWVALVMNCVTSVSFSVLIEGRPSPVFVPQRGLRQGDPLSPFLFLLCAEGLSGLIRKSEQEGRLDGIAIARGAPRVSHLFFADDSVIFARATSQQASEIVNILKMYGAASGQQVNFAKSEISFSRNVSGGVRQQLQQVMQIKEVAKHERYLGLPTMVGRSKKLIFGQLKERIWNKVRGWKEKTLSRGGKEVLIKSIAQAIPTYTMSCFKLPASLCQDIEQQLCKFWWGDGSDKQKVHWLKWKRMCLSKAKGGMGFRDMEMFNKALLARQGWRLIQDPESLIARMLKARYFPRTSFLDATVGHQPSYTWRSLLEGRDALVLGLKWHIGNGAQIRVFEDQWLPRPTGFRPIANPRNFGADLRVVDLIDWGRKAWDEDIVREVFLPMDAEVVLNIRLTEPDAQDELIWHYSRNGCFSVRSAYHLLMERFGQGGGASSSVASGTERVWKKIWTVEAAPRIRNLLWRACKGVLPCSRNLRLRHMLQCDLCPWCGVQEDDIHSLFKCRYARAVWDLASGVHRFGEKARSVMEAFDLASSTGSKDELQLWVHLIDAIWTARNKRIFNQTEVDPGWVFSQAVQDVVDYNRGSKVWVIPPPRVAAVDESKWEKPPIGFVKINSDAAVDERKGCGVGCVARNEAGELVFAAAKTTQRSDRVELVEAEGLAWALQLCAEMGLSKIWVETDCLPVIMMLRSAAYPRGEVGDQLRIISRLAGLFAECRWSHIRRQANRVADFLAGIRPTNSMFLVHSDLRTSELNLLLDNDLS